MTARLHVALDVADLDRSIRFYDRLFDAPPARREPDYARFEPADLALVLSLNPRAMAPTGPQRLSHLGVRVTSAEALDLLRQRLAAAGLATREEQGTACCYAFADKLWTRDPDGNDWELYLRLGDAPVRYPGVGECCAPAADAGVDSLAAGCCGPQ